MIHRILEAVCRPHDQVTAIDSMIISVVVLAVFAMVCLIVFAIAVFATRKR